MKEGVLVQKGDEVYYLENGRHLTKGVIISKTGTRYTIKTSSSAAIRLPESRIYMSENEAKENIDPKYIPNKKTPYDWE